eukprot:jgi/Botrbrau1/7676/Bobra.0159s0118.1
MPVRAHAWVCVHAFLYATLLQYYKNHCINGCIHELNGMAIMCQTCRLLYKQR